MIKIAKLSLVFFAGLVAVVLYLGLLTAMTASADTADSSLAAALAAPPAAPLLQSGGPDIYGYTYQDEAESPFGPSYDFIDISGTGAPLNLDDEGWQDISLPFNFSFYGSNSDVLRVSNNGAAIFAPGPEDKVSASNVCPLPHTSKIIAPWWDDWGSAGDVYLEFFGSAPNQYAVIQWTGMIHFPSTTGDAVTFQMVLYETSNVILFQYQDTQTGGGHENGRTGAIGIGGAAAGNSLEYGCDAPVLDSGRAIRFQRSGVTVSKVAVDSTGLEFDFTVTGADGPASFSLTDGENRATYTLPGAYTVVEDTVPEDWGLGALSCSSSLAAVAGFNGQVSQFSTYLVTRTADISLLAPGDQVSCLFTNVNGGRVVVDKVTLPAGDPTEFSFELNGGPGNLSEQFVLSDTAEVYTSPALPPGVYSLSETSVPGWDLLGATCDSGDINNITINAGDTVTCVFTNSRRARLEVEKVTLPLGQAGTPFNFTLTGGPPAAPVNQTFPLSATVGLAGIDDLRPGTYNLSEAAVQGWLQEASCDNGDSPASINLTAGDTVRCVFTNTQQGRISVTKVTDPADESTPFNISIYGPGDVLKETLSVSAPTSPLLSNYLDPGYTYSITEPVQYANWDLTGASCDKGSPGAVPIEPGDVVNCVFNNTKRATIVVDKVTDPAGDPTSFGFNISGPDGIDDSFSLTDGATPHSRPNLLPGGPYVVTETTVAPNWDLTGLACDDIPDNNEFMLDPGQTITCVFTNTARPARILVDKVTLPAGDTTSFEFTRSGGPAGTLPESFTLSGGDGYDSGDLKPGVYSVAENAPGEEWHVASSCDNDGSPASISLAAGQTVSCVFTNTRRGRILVDKVTDPAGDPTSFNFSLTGSGLNQPFSLTDGSAAYGSSTYLNPGVYTVTEATPAGWNLTGQSCNGGSPASMTLDPGETITCVFTNTAQPGSLAIVKDANDEDWDFQFQIVRKQPQAILHEFILNDGAPATNSISYTLPHGSYEVNELASSGGWSLSDINCVDPSGNTTKEVSFGRANVELAAGEHITCTFINRINPSVGSITIVKSAVPTGTQSFGFTGSLGSFFLSDGGLQPNQYSVLGLPAGRYVITETATAGWSLNDVSCSGGITSRQGSAVVIDLLGSQNVSCTFTNIADAIPPASITIVKSAIPTGPQAFGFTGDLGNFSLSDGGSLASSRQFSGLTPGAYVITETALSGWQVDSISCSGGSWTQAGASAAAITLAGGENVSCTFVNRAASSGSSTVFLPLVMKAGVTLPNLVGTLSVDTSVNPPLVTVVVRNVGDAPVNEPFWVDFYVNPTTRPGNLTGPDRRWQRVSTRGIAWPITAPLAANGGSVTLSSAGGFDPVQTNWGPLPAGPYTFYSFVDSYDNNDPEGATYVEIKESNEADNESMVSVVISAGAALSLEQPETPDPGRYPPRSEP